MALRRANGPYVWVTWLTKLLVGEDSCEWASWFRSQHEGWSWEKAPSTLDLDAWLMEHTQKLNEVRQQWEANGYLLSTENQNSFTLKGNAATLGGKPDLIARKDDIGTIIDVKTGQPRPSHSIQVMIYMYAIPRALGQYKDIALDGKVVYADHEIDIPAFRIDDAFIGSLSQLIVRLGSDTPARKVPSLSECGFCNITSSNCPERMTEDSFTEDF